MSDPVVEELLEKGARAAWDSDSPMASWEQVPPKLQAGYRSQVSAAFDAVFPGWREGITREWRAVFSYPPSILGPTSDSYSRPVTNRVEVPTYAPSSEETHGWRSAIESRLVGPWVPVEEGTT